MCVYASVCVCVCVRTQVCVCVCECVCVCMCMHKYSFTLLLIKITALESFTSKWVVQVCQMCLIVNELGISRQANYKGVNTIYKRGIEGGGERDRQTDRDWDKE